MKLDRLLLARGLLWLARSIDRSPVPAPVDRPATLREMTLALARAKLARWRRALQRDAS